MYHNSMRYKASVSQLDRIMTRVDKRKDGCWIWTGKGRTGLHGEYGGVRCNGKQMSTHRAVWILLRGPIDGIDLLHQCPNKLCCNPDHLNKGDQKKNLQEALEARGGKPWQADGETHCNAKLSDDDVRAIRKRCRNGASQSSVAKMFNVTQPCISQIINRKWRKSV